MTTPPPLLTPTAYFPPLAWCRAAAARGGRWRWQGAEHYQKGGWRNRCRIATANGPLLLSVPLRGGKHRQQPIAEVAIDYTADWWRIHEMTLRSAYGRAPFFEHYAETIFAPARRRPPTLLELNCSLMKVLAPLLGLPQPPELLNEFVRAGSREQNFLGDAPPPEPTYPQVFSDRHGFTPGLSVLDALFCRGPAALLP